MWKYVSRRIRESIEKTYNVFDVKRSWACEKIYSCPSNDNSDEHPNNYCNQNKEYTTTLCASPIKYLCLQKQWKKNFANKDDCRFKERARNDEYMNCPHRFLEALTWV